MGLRQRLTEDMKAAMKAKNARRLSAIRLMLDAVQKQDIATKSDISCKANVATLSSSRSRV
jgi:hypothetical protein